MRRRANTVESSRAGNRELSSESAPFHHSLSRANPAESTLRLPPNILHDTDPSLIGELFLFSAVAMLSSAFERNLTNVGYVPSFGGSSQTWARS